MKKRKVGLVVDNPNRDLEGLVLVAAYLAKMNFHVILIPMYKQRFIARSQNVDIIVLNYLRPNNLETFLDCLRAGIKVAVLDTEGIAGRDFEEYADFFCKTKMTQLIDLYMFWGPAQLNAVRERENYVPKSTTVTGCPRYDFFVEPWLRAIDNQVSHRNFVLFNTNFPIVNPKFSTGKEDEYKTMLAVGFTPAAARSSVRQNMAAFLGMKRLVSALAQALPNESFVLRPHPFENVDGYKDLEVFDNVEVIQSGSANSWIHSAKALVHLNCTTAIEASLMGKLVVTPSWLNDSAIYRALPDRLSRAVESIDEMIEVLGRNECLTDITQKSPVSAKKGVLEQSFHHVDGRSAARVAEALRDLAFMIGSSSTIPKRSILQEFKNIVLNISELPVLWQLRERLKNINSSKYFTSEGVQEILNRLILVEPSFKSISVSDLARNGHSQSKFSDVVAVNLRDIGDG